jgi:hypothetical protein
MFLHQTQDAVKLGSELVIVQCSNDIAARALCRISAIPARKDANFAKYIRYHRPAERDARPANRLRAE